MAVLSKETIQRLAVLRALSMWQRGAYGPVRLHKTLFFADKHTGETWRLFTFKKWLLGQYSDDIADALNSLREAGVATTSYDGPSERIKADLPGAMSDCLTAFFAAYFPQWNKGLGRAFQEWAYLSNDNIIRKAHEEPSYRNAEHGEVIFSSFDAERVEFSGLKDETAEELSDLVDARYQRGLVKRLSVAGKRPAEGENWRRIYFGKQARSEG